MLNTSDGLDMLLRGLLVPGLIVVLCSVVLGFLCSLQSIDSGDRFRFCRMLGTGMEIIGGAGTGCCGNKTVCGLTC